MRDNLGEKDGMPVGTALICNKCGLTMDIIRVLRALSIGNGEVG